MQRYNSIQDKISKEVADYGRGLVSVKYPSEIEVYLIALELTDSSNITQQYFVFPVMPSSISKTENNRNSIKKSASGTTVLMSPSYVPAEISIKGDFGKGFKFLSNPTGEEFSFGIFRDVNKEKFQTTSPTLDPNVKSGFGCTKILQGIIKEANQLDKLGKPNRLYLYNLALGESYLVLAQASGGLSISQSYERNMIWGYNLNLSILADISQIIVSSDLSKASKSVLGAKGIQNSVNVLAGEIGVMLGNLL